MSTRKQRPARPKGDEPLRAVAYLRLSKAKAKPGDTEVGLDTQLAGCERAVEALGGTVVAVERDIRSGDRLDRPGLWAAVDRIRAGEANALIIYALDRFGRDQDQQGVAAVAVKQAGGRLLSATENLEEGPLGDFLRSAYNFAAAIELAKIRERTKRGLNAKFRDAGKYKPSTRPPYGYRKTGTGTEATYDLEPAEAAIVERIFRERAAGASLRAIPAGLTRDGIPTPRGGTNWRADVVKDLLDRSTYHTGEHVCWQTEITRDADGVPYRDGRPAEERYTVTFPPIIDTALAERARATAQRNVWKSRRGDRSPEVGALRYGFARCAGCGRAMSVTTSAPGNGRTRYQCTSRLDCPAPAGISKDVLDRPILRWLQDVIEDPERADAYHVVQVPAVPNAEALGAATAAEARVGELEQHIAGLIDNLMLLTGPVAEQAAARLNALNAELGEARAERDRRVAACRVVGGGEDFIFHPKDVLAAAVFDAVQAMKLAEPGPGDDPDGADIILHAGPQLMCVGVKLSWRAWQAALSTLNVVVTVAQESSDLPRWAADIRLAEGVTVSAAATCLGSRRSRQTWPARAGNPWRSTGPRAAARPD